MISAAEDPVSDLARPLVAVVAVSVAPRPKLETSLQIVQPDTLLAGVARALASSGGSNRTVGNPRAIWKRRPSPRSNAWHGKTGCGVPDGSVVGC